MNSKRQFYSQNTPCPSRAGNSIWAVLAVIAILMFGVAVFVILTQTDEKLSNSSTSSLGTKTKSIRVAAPDAPSPKVVTNLVNSENLILELTVELKKLNQSVINCSLPDPLGEELFAHSIFIADLNEQETNVDSFDSIGTESFRQSIGEGRDTELASLIIWDSVLRKIDVDSFSHASFKIVRGDFARLPGANEIQPKLDTSKFDTLVKFDGLARLKNRVLDFYPRNATNPLEQRHQFQLRQLEN